MRLKKIKKTFTIFQPLFFCSFYKLKHYNIHLMRHATPSIDLGESSRA